MATQRCHCPAQHGQEVIEKDNKVYLSGTAKLPFCGVQEVFHPGGKRLFCREASV